VADGFERRPGSAIARQAFLTKRTWSREEREACHGKDGAGGGCATLINPSGKSKWPMALHVPDATTIFGSARDGPSSWTLN
jgi:hypothetical protein